MRRIKPIIKCVDCRWFYVLGQGPETVLYCELKGDGKKLTCHDSTCFNAEPREIGTCGECFWSVEHEAAKISQNEKYRTFLECHGNVLCGARGPVSQPKHDSPGGPYWWPKP